MGGWVTTNTVRRPPHTRRRNGQIEKTSQRRKRAFLHRKFLSLVRTRKTEPKPNRTSFHHVTGLQHVEGSSNSRYQVVLAKDPSYFPKTQPGPKCSSTDVEPAAPETQPLQPEAKDKADGPTISPAGLTILLEPMQCTPVTSHHPKPNPTPATRPTAPPAQARLRLCESLVLKLSKSGSGIWAPFPLSMDQNMEGWTNFYLSKTSKKGPYLTRGKK